MIVRARAPLRLGFAGGGTDVPPFSDQHGGFVMNATIDRFAYATIDRSPSGRLELHSLDGDAHDSRALGDVDLGFGALQLMSGVYWRMGLEYPEILRAPIRIRSHSDAPPGSGLGSSSTMVVALVTAFVEFFGLPLGEYEVAHLAHSIERVDLNLAGGKQDQYAAAFGGFNFMEFYDDDRVIVNPLRIKDWLCAELEASLVLYFTGVSRSSARIIEEQSRNVIEGNRQSVDAMLRLKEEAVQMKEALLRCDLVRFAEVLQSSWQLKKMMANSIANTAIDAVEDVAMRNGAVAAKVSGAGGGGFMMFMCDPADRIRLSRALVEHGGSLLDFHFHSGGAVAWKCRSR
jgi:D-glycero-alpha-D-manno-heptose-7-phosphate kinase